MSRKQIKRRAGSMTCLVIAGFFIVAIVSGAGQGAASASDVDDVARAGAFGFTERIHSATVPVADEAVVRPADQDERPLFENPVLSAVTPRDIEASMPLVEEMQRVAQSRSAEENAAAIARTQANREMQGFAAPEDGVQGVGQADESAYNLPAVDWTTGKDAFLAEWTARIDKYLEGSTLEGYGEVFAEAAWENGVDPRWSPAISNTESGKGSACFLPCNAWGWGSSGWSDWDTAIRAHVSGLGRLYGYSITPTAAQVYCPPTWSDWYSVTIAQMALI